MAASLATAQEVSCTSPLTTCHEAGGFGSDGEAQFMGGVPSRDRLARALLVTLLVVGIVAGFDALYEMHAIARSLAFVSDDLSTVSSVNRKLDALASLDRELRRTSASVAGTGRNFAALDTRLDALATLPRLDAKLDALGDIESSIRSTNRSLAAANAELTTTNRQLVGLRTLADVDRKLDVLGGLEGDFARVALLNGRFDTANGNIAGLKDELGSVDAELASIKGELAILQSLDTRVEHVERRIDRSTVLRL